MATMPAAVRTARCKVCDSASAPFGVARVLSSIDVQYFQCPACRFVQTEAPYWLAEAYASALIAADVGAARRNLDLAGVTQTVIQRFFRADASFLDYGGGYGLFVRLMRDRGFDFRWHDRYAANLMSMGFAAAPDETGFELVTAFEVLEHLVDPVPEIEAMLGRGGALLCTTLLLPPDNPKPGAWWYYAPSGGQHVSLYTLESLRHLARRFGCHLATNGASLHLFSKRPTSDRLFRLVTRRRVSAVLNRLHPRRSLIASDFERITGERLV